MKVSLLSHESAPRSLFSNGKVPNKLECTSGARYKGVSRQIEKGYLPSHLTLLTLQVRHPVLLLGVALLLTLT